MQFWMQNLFFVSILLLKILFPYKTLKFHLRKRSWQLTNSTVQSIFLITTTTKQKFSRPRTTEIKLSHYILTKYARVYKKLRRHSHATPSLIILSRLRGQFLRIRNITWRFKKRGVFLNASYVCTPR